MRVRSIGGWRSVATGRLSLAPPGGSSGLPCDVPCSSLADYRISPDEFRQLGHRVVDWVADYLETIEQRPVTSRVEPGWVRAQLPASPPERPEPWDQILADLDRIVLPGVTHWQHPGWFAYFPANSSGPSVLGDLVSSGLGVQGMLWSTSASVHRAGDARARLARRTARTAGALPQRRPGWRRDPGLGVVGQPLRPAGGTLARRRRRPL